MGSEKGTERGEPQKGFEQEVVRRDLEDRPEDNVGKELLTGVTPFFFVAMTKCHDQKRLR